MQLIPEFFRAALRVQREPANQLKCNSLTFLAFLLLALAPRVAWGQFKYYDGNSWQNTPYLYTAYYYTDNNGTIYVTGNGNIYRESNHTIEISKNITICVENRADYGKFTLTRAISPYEGLNYPTSIVVNSGYTLTIKNIIIDGGGSAREHIVPLFKVLGTMVMVGESKSGSGYDPDNCKIINCVKKNGEGLRNGSAIHAIDRFEDDYGYIYYYGGRLECNSVTFEDNQNRDLHSSNSGKTYGGGALAFHNGATFSLTNCIFNNNEAYESAGAIFLEYAGSGEINNCTFDGNISYWAGGAIYGILNDGATINITGATTFRNNQVNYSTSLGLSQPGFLGLGGAIYFLSGRTCTFNIGDGTNTVSFENNYARYCGGAICIFCEYANSHFNLRKFSMTGNHTNDNGYVPRPNATDGGGALYIFGSEEDDHADDHIVIRNGTISNNYAVNHGGAMLVTMHDSEVQDVTFEGNYTTASESKGGAVKIIGKDHNYTHTNSFIRCNFYKNGINGSTTMTKYGGALYSVNETNVEILGCTIGGSEANANKAIADGGGIYIGEDSYLTMDSKVATGSYNTMEVSYNEAGNDGGGIYVANGAQGHTNIGTNSNISYPVKINNNVAAFNGGGIALHCSGTANDLFTLRNFELKNNRALQGGGAYLQGGHISGVNHGAMTINNGTVQDNHAASAGGGIYFDEHDANVSYVGFIHNATNKGTTSSNTGAGGGVLIAGHSNHAVADHDHDFTNCTFTQNEASFGGAAMIMRKTTAEFINCTIGGSVADKNTASINGGGVYVEELSKADFINGTEVSYNEAVNGGGVYVAGSGSGSPDKVDIDCSASINVLYSYALSEYFGIYTKSGSTYTLVSGTDMSLTGPSASSVLNVSNLQAGTNYYVRTKLDNENSSYNTDNYSWYYQIQCELSGITGKIRIYDADWNTYVDYTEPYHWNKPARANLSGAAYSHSMETIATSTYFYDIIHFQVVPDGASEIKSGVVSIENGSSVQNNIASNKGGGVYKLGTLQVEGLVTITDNKAGATPVVNNVYIPTNSADDQTILIADALTCGSSIGVTKTKTDHTYDDDDNFPQVRTAIAKNEVNNSGNALTAFNRNVFFDDTDNYGVWCMNYQKGGNLSDPKAYSVENDYFIETWRNFADASGFASNRVSTAAGLAHFAKSVNAGNDYANSTILQVADIDLGAHYWEPTGFSTGSTCDPVTDYKFSGNFDGQGHLIRNAISILPTKTMGLFGNVDGGSVIRTFNIGADFTGTFDDETHIGGIAGQVTGTSPLIDRCEAQGSMQRYGSAASNTGGIAGNVASGEVRNSFAVASTLSGSTVGGLVGNNNAGSVKNAYAVNNTLPGSGTVGALVGNNTGTLSNAYTDASSGKVVGAGTGTNVYSAGATGATATYTAPIGADQLGYMYADNLVSGGAFGGKPLFEALSIGAERLNGDDEDEATENTPGYRTYDRWARPALAYYEMFMDISYNDSIGIVRPINGDLPVLMMNNYGDGTDGKVGRGGFTALSTITEPEVFGVEGGPEAHPAYLIGDGYVLQYSGPKRDYSAYNNDSYYNDSEIDGMIARSGITPGEPLDCHFVYGDVSKAPTMEIFANRISIYEHAAITQAGTLGSFDMTHVSITFDNSRAELGGSLPVSTEGINQLDAQKLPRDWHLLSTPLTNAPVGFNYKQADGTTDTNVKGGWNSGNTGTYANNPWVDGTEFGWLGQGRYWMDGWKTGTLPEEGGMPALFASDGMTAWTDGYFPSAVSSLHTIGENGVGCINDEEGRYPYGMDFYSWSEPQYHFINFKRNGPNHWHSDLNNEGLHSHLDYTPEVATNNTDGWEGVPATFGKNVNEERLLTGKGYFTSIAVKTLLQSSGQLGGNIGQTSDDNGEEPGGFGGKGVSGSRLAFEKTIALTKNENDLDLCEGWNLVGNPFHAYLDFDEFVKDGGLNSEMIPDKTYVVYNADGYKKNENGNYGDGFSYYVAGGSAHGAYAGQYLHPHQGFFVKVDESTTLTFKEGHVDDGGHVVLRSEIGTDGGFRSGDARPAYPLVNLFLSSAKGCSDVCVVEFNRPEWGGATKMREMRSGNGLFYAYHDDKNYAALFATPEAERIPIKFESKEPGGDTYTIRWNTANGDFSRLYLVDNLTGVQYDMLSHDSYSFNGQPGDYWSRFYITFAVTGVDEEDDDDTPSNATTFAFFDGSEWVVTHDGHGTATLQLVDLQGRVLKTATVAEGQTHVGLPNVASGMYLLRMSTTKGTQVQKIIVR